jgi:acylphosphatase
MALPNDSRSPQTEAAVHVIVRGRVQGVGYRFFVLQRAVAEGLAGWVRNLPNGDVELEAQGPKIVLERWLEHLRKGPPLAQVNDVQIRWFKALKKLSSFNISD